MCSRRAGVTLHLEFDRILYYFDRMLMTPIDSPKKTLLFFIFALQTKTKFIGHLGRIYPKIVNIWSKWYSTVEAFLLPSDRYHIIYILFGPLDIPRVSFRWCRLVSYTLWHPYGWPFKRGSKLASLALVSWQVPSRVSFMARTVPTNRYAIQLSLFVAFGM